MFSKPTQMEKYSTMVLSALSEGPKTTLELREIGVFSVGVIIKDLREKGHYIITGHEGQTAKYALIPLRKIKEGTAQ